MQASGDKEQRIEDRGQSRLRHSSSRMADFAQKLQSLIDMGFDAKQATEALKVFLPLSSPALLSLDDSSECCLDVGKCDSMSIRLHTAERAFHPLLWDAKICWRDLEWAS